MICLNIGQRNLLAEHGISRIEVIPHGIDRKVFPVPPASRPVRTEGPVRLGLVSRRYRGIKGETRLEELFQHLDRASFCLRLRWLRPVGGCRARAGRRVCRPAMEALPYPLFGRLYEAMDVLLVLSDFEGGPACLPEALGAGVPVASRPVGMVPEWLRDGDNGLILEGHNAGRTSGRPGEPRPAGPPQCRCMGGAPLRSQTGGSIADRQFALYRAILKRS